MPDPVPIVPPYPPIGELELGRLARAAIALRHDLEAAAEQGDLEAQGVLAHNAEQQLKRGEVPDHAAISRQRILRMSAKLGDPEARDVLVHNAEQQLKRWAPPPSRQRRPPPPGISPQGLSRLEAAAFVGIGATTFYNMVRDGRLPQPRRFGRRAIWDRDALAAALGGTPLPAANGAESNPWDDLLEGRP